MRWGIRALIVMFKSFAYVLLFANLSVTVALLGRAEVSLRKAQLVSLREEEKKLESVRRFVNYIAR